MERGPASVGSRTWVSKVGEVCGRVRGKWVPGSTRAALTAPAEHDEAGATRDRPRRRPRHAGELEGRGGGDEESDERCVGRHCCASMFSAEEKEIARARGLIAWSVIFC